MLGLKLYGLIHVRVKGPPGRPSGDRKISRNHEGQREIWENMSNFEVITVAADGLAPYVLGFFFCPGMINLSPDFMEAY